MGLMSCVVCGREDGMHSNRRSSCQTVASWRSFMVRTSDSFTNGQHMLQKQL